MIESRGRLVHMNDFDDKNNDDENLGDVVSLLQLQNVVFNAMATHMHLEQNAHINNDPELQMQLHL